MASEQTPAWQRSAKSIAAAAPFVVIVFLIFAVVGYFGPWLTDIETSLDIDTAAYGIGSSFSGEKTVGTIALVFIGLAAAAALFYRVRPSGEAALVTIAAAAITVYLGITELSDLDSVGGGGYVGWGGEAMVIGAGGAGLVAVIMLLYAPKGYLLPKVRPDGRLPGILSFGLGSLFSRLLDSAVARCRSAAQLGIEAPTACQAIAAW